MFQPSSLFDAGDIIRTILRTSYWIKKLVKQKFVVKTKLCSRKHLRVQKKLGHKTLCSRELKLSNIFWRKKFTKRISPKYLGQKKKNRVKKEVKIFLAPRKIANKLILNKEFLV